MCSAISYIPSPISLPPVLVAALAALAVQLLAWAWIAAGLRTVREAQPADGAPEPADPAAFAGLAALQKRLQGVPEAPPPDPPSPDAAPPPLPVSVVVAAHDEEAGLPPLLDRLAAQTHRPFEVVVVDDRSTDSTAAVVGAHAARWAATGDGPALRLVRVTEAEREAAGLPPKKHALTRGVAEARHDRLAFTDADGRPPPTWLATLARHAAAPPPDGRPEGRPEGVPDGSPVLIGYGPYRKAPGLLNLFVRYETVVTATLTAAAFGHGRPYMAVGRNLSYPRALFDRVGGFAGGADLLSGDDDLLVQEAARAGWPVRYVLDRGAFVESAAPPTAGAWVRQKRRHASAGRRYPAAVLAGLGLFHLSALAVWLAPVVVGWPGAALLAVRLLVQRAALAPALGAFDARDLTLAQPLLDALYALYNVGFSVLGALPSPRRW